MNVPGKAITGDILTLHKKFKDSFLLFHLPMGLEGRGLLANVIVVPTVKLRKNSTPPSNDRHSY